MVLVVEYLRYRGIEYTRWVRMVAGRGRSTCIYMLLDCSVVFSHWFRGAFRMLFQLKSPCLQFGCQNVFQNFKCVLQHDRVADMHAQDVSFLCQDKKIKLKIRTHVLGRVYRLCLSLSKTNMAVMAPIKSSHASQVSQHIHHNSFPVRHIY